jgi:imidazolonepropionase-like amidohydrolase
MKSLVLVLLLAGSAQAAETVTAVTGGRVVTVDGPELAKGTVLISGGKITAVGKDIPVPTGAKVIDASGKVVYPGLIDGLTDLGLAEISGVPATVDVSEVGDVNPHAKAWVALNVHSDLIPVARANGITTVLTAPKGGLISGQSALIKLAGSTPASLVVRAPVAMHMVYPSGRRREERPSSGGDDQSQRPGEERTFADRQRERRENQQRELRRLTNLLEEAKAYGLALDAAKQGKAARPKADIPMEALAAAARGQVPVIMRADDAEDIRGAVKFATERKLKLIIAGGLEAWRCTDVLKQANVPVLLTVDRLPRREADPYDAAFANAAHLHAAGVRFAIVSDADSKARNLPYEAAMARAFGLPAAVALRSITLTPAEIFGVADHLGSLAEGKDANLMITTGDIMDHRTVVTHVFIDGVLQPPDTRHTRLYQQFKDRP